MIMPKSRARDYISDRVFDGVRPIDKKRVASIKRSFFDGLTDDQKKQALEYDGPENHGDPEYLRRT